MSNRKEELRQAANQALAQLWEIEEAEAQEINSALTGKCYKSRNSYSCPQTEADYWWLYTRITGGKGKILYGTKFQRTNDDRIEILFGSFVGSEITSGYQEIPEGELLEAWRRVRDEVNATSI